ncbi:hypothetical protein M5W83_21825 [Paenibacillus thiaminolyticus]|uniref:Uncharacterized protein n=1 Tax=Paenibacillus thiaminolyticus TaxID=49283 RepID=A0AAP9DX67_PANTH|nr:hypothetical protein [Paenibacillus thiaminolyticus]MCY9533787.1 hypothetical protein [Paenibacillus thiaminolyticus]MCY9604408.1 hypothetical protein [Paenibacillus thiaminolyticus]MCY9609796.1 hypothetical protein [Paenibacillus thiaminolyticus]MCY9613740.1 hypothetical protein [Paenibacillus thiaminolyticus]MCY9620642.1 hypothetical protein [Paenibacillus thiaminolyticus]
MKKIGMGLRIVLLAGVLALALAPGAASLAAAASGGSGAAESADRIAAMNQDERAQYFEQTAQRLDEAERKLAQSKALYLDVPYSSIDSKLLDAKLAYARAASDDSGRDAAQLSQQVAALERFLTEAEHLNTESRKVELRGIRLRVSPSPGDNESGQVRERLERIKAAHFNAVFLEVGDRAGAGADPRASGSANSGAAANPDVSPSETANPSANLDATANPNANPSTSLDAIANWNAGPGETVHPSASPGATAATNPFPASPASAARPSFAAMQVYIEEGAKLGLAVYAGEAGPFGGKQGAAIVDIRIGAETEPSAVRKLIRENGADHGIGAIITGEEAFFAGGYERELWFGLYRSQAALPERDATKPVRVLLEQMSRKVGAIYVPFGGMSGAAAERYQPLLDLLASSLSRTPEWSGNAAASMRGTLVQLREYIRLDTEVKAEVRNRLNEDIAQCIELLEAHLDAQRASASAAGKESGSGTGM